MEKFVDEKSPPDPPSPVKSNRITPKPRSVRAVAMTLAAAISFEQVKQWAKSANPLGSLAGRSILAASFAPLAPENSTFRGWGDMSALLGVCQTTPAGRPPHYHSEYENYSTKACLW